MRKEIILNFIITISVSLVAFFQNKYFIEYIGIEELGLIKLFTQLLQYLNIIEMGIGNASTFSLYKPLLDKNIKQISIIVSTMRSIYNKIAIILFILGLLITPVIPFFIKSSDFTNDIYIYWILYMINTISTYLFVKYTILFTANQEFMYVRYVQGGSKFLYQILQIMCIIEIQSMYIYIVLLLLDNITQYIFFRKHFYKNYKYIYKTEEKFMGIKEDIKKLFWHKLSALIVYNTDLILISKFVSIEIVGIYASYQMILQMILTMTNIIINVLRPKIGRYISSNKKDDIFSLFKKIDIIFFLISIICGFINYNLINDFISIWIGKEYVLNEIVVLLISLNLFISVFKLVLALFKECSGFFDDIESPIIEAIINFILSLYLGIRYGLSGIIVGTIISSIIMMLIYRPILVFRRCFDKNIYFCIKFYLKYIVIGTILLILLNFNLALLPNIDVNNWFNWIIKLILMLFISIISSMMILLINKDLRNILKKRSIF